MAQYERQWGRDENEKTPASRLNGLIRRAYEKSGRRVVVLIDEYDKPLFSTFDKPELHEQYKNILKGFFGILKSQDACLIFVFLTGVTKFSGVSIFSDLNHLDDISMDREYAGICGISEWELLAGFQPEIQVLADEQSWTYNEAVAKLKRDYNGYHFSKESEDMYNPFSVLNTFVKKDISSYWFVTGTPTFLVKMLKSINFNLPELEGDIQVTASEMYDYRADNANPVPVLYQSGYLTIKGYDRKYGEYRLGFPNEEVKFGFLNGILSVYASDIPSINGYSATEMVKALRRNDTEAMMQMLQSFFASIPSDMQEKRYKNEKYFQSLFYTVFALMGQFVQTEVKSANGRADACENCRYHLHFRVQNGRQSYCRRRLETDRRKGLSHSLSVGWVQPR
jgi:hypothetical protein